MLSFFRRVYFLLILFCWIGYDSLAQLSISSEVYKTNNTNEFLVNIHIREGASGDFKIDSKNQYLTIGFDNTDYEFVTTDLNASISMDGGGTIPTQPNSTDITSTIFTFAYNLQNTGGTQTINILRLRVRKTDGTANQSVNIVRVTNSIDYTKIASPGGMHADITGLSYPSSTPLANIAPNSAISKLSLQLNPSSTCIGTTTSVEFTVQLVQGAIQYRLLELNTAGTQWNFTIVTPDATTGKFTRSINTTTALTKTFKVVADIYIDPNDGSFDCLIEGDVQTFTIGSGPTAPTFSKLTNSSVCLDAGNDGDFDFKISNYNSSNSYSLYRRSPSPGKVYDIDNNDIDANGEFTHHVDNLTSHDRVYYVSVTSGGCSSNSGDVTVKMVEKPVISLKNTIILPIPISTTDLPRVMDGTNGVLNTNPTNMQLTFSSNPSDGSTIQTIASAAIATVNNQFNPYGITTFNTPIGVVANGAVDGCPADPFPISFTVRDGFATIPSFVKPVSTMPICENYPNNKFDLIAYVRNCGFNASNPGFTITATYKNGSSTVDESLPYTYAPTENLSENNSVTDYAYAFSINPLRHNGYVVKIVISKPTGGTCSNNRVLTGFIPINPRRAPFLTGLPINSGAFTTLCSASHDTIYMNANPSNGKYNFYKGKLSNLPVITPGTTLTMAMVRSQALKPVDSLRAIAPPKTDKSMERFVPAEVFSEHLSSDLDSIIIAEYIYPNSGSCPDTTFQIFNFNPAINVTTNIPDKICYGDTLKLNISYGSGVTSDANNTQDNFYWNFGDGFSINNDTSSLQNYIYKNPGLYPVRFKSKMSVLPPSTCNNDILDTIRVGAQPEANFRVFNNFEDLETSFADTSAILVRSLTDVINGNENDTIVSWYWDFGTSPAFTHLSTLGGDTVFVYNNVMEVPYEVKLTVTAKHGCQDTKSRSIPIFPMPTLVNGGNYKETFTQNTITGWFESGQYKDRDTLSCWKNISPNGHIIKSYTGDAWVTTESMDTTATYNPLERSWVESPVFDLSDIDLPMVTFDNISNTDPNYDGVVLQYAFVDTVAFGEEKWISLGRVDQGLEWYNSPIILGLQNDHFIGWSGKSQTDWQLSAYPLEEIKEKINNVDKLVRFRFLLGTNGDNDVKYPYFEGFAFDNFYIGTRNRRVVIEEFCDYTTGNYDLGDIVDDKSVFDTLQGYYIQYHSGLFTNSDRIFNENPDEPSARALHYGIGKNLPRGVIDGILYDNSDSLSNWGPDEFLKRTLVVSPFDMNVVIEMNGTNDSLSIETTITRIDNAFNGRNLLLHVAVVEREVKGNTNNQQFANVLRNMVPNAAGTRLDASTNWGSPQVTHCSWTPFTDPNSAFNIIAYLQDEDSKEIYQAFKVIVPQSDVATLISNQKSGGHNENNISFNEMSIQPNPIADDLRVVFNGILNSSYVYTISDSYGRVLLNGNLSSGINAAFIETQALPSGIYHLTVNGEGRVMTQKFAVVK